MGSWCNPAAIRRYLFSLLFPTEDGPEPELSNEEMWDLFDFSRIKKDANGEVANPPHEEIRLKILQFNEMCKAMSVEAQPAPLKRQQSYVPSRSPSPDSPLRPGSLRRAKSCP